MDIAVISRETIPETRTLDEIAPRNSADLVRMLTQDDSDLFAIVSGGLNPAYLALARTDPFHRFIAQGMRSGSLISVVPGTKLPGLSTSYLAQMPRPAHPVAG